jgi:hypothetical protein
VVVPRTNLSMYKKAIHESLEEAAEVRETEENSSFVDR